MPLKKALENSTVKLLREFKEGINNDVEIEIEGYTLTGSVDIDLNNKFQEFTLLELYDNDLCCDINFSKKDQNIINDWFQNLELEVKTN